MSSNNTVVTDYNTFKMKVFCNIIIFSNHKNVGT
jgi:hypothetical protein